MVQHRQQRRLALDPGDVLRVFRERGRKDFDGHLAIKLTNYILLFFACIAMIAATADLVIGLRRTLPEWNLAGAE